MHKRHLSPASGIALVALFFALGGTAIAANHYLITNTNQIKPNVVKQLRGHTGAQGVTGATGAQGVAGPSVLGALVRVTGPDTILPAGVDGSSTADCPAGYGIVSGGYVSISAGGSVFASDSFGGESWSALLDNFSSPISADVQAFAFCAPTGQALAPSVRHSAIQPQVDAALAAQRALDARGH